MIFMLFVLALNWQIIVVGYDCYDGVYDDDGASLSSSINLTL